MVRILDYIALLILSALLVFLPFAQVVSGYQMIILLGILGVGAVVALRLVCVEGYTRSLWNSLTYIDIGVLLIGLAVLVGACSSLYAVESFRGVLKWGIYVVFYAICVALTHRRKLIIHSLLLVCFVGLLYACCEGLLQAKYGVLSLATWQDPSIPVAQRFSRIYSLFLNPNLFGIYLLPFWSLGLYYAYRFYTQKKYLWVSVFCILTLMSLYCLAQTGCRGAWIACFIQGSLVGLILSRYIPVIWCVGLFSVGASAILLYLSTQQAFLSRILSIFTPYGDSSNSFRMNVWQACFQIFHDNPLWGIGIGSDTFYLVYGAYMTSQYSALGAYSKRTL